MVKVYVVPKPDASKLEKFKVWCKNRKTDIECFWAENKEEIVALTPVVIGGALAAGKAISKHRAIKAEQILKDRKIYDPRMGHYYEMSRKPTNLQWAEIDQRFRNGEGYGDILKDMGLLKR